MCCALNYPGLAMIAARQFPGTKKWRPTKTRAYKPKDARARNNGVFSVQSEQFHGRLIRKNGGVMLEQSNCLRYLASYYLGCTWTPWPFGRPGRLRDAPRHSHARRRGKPGCPTALTHDGEVATPNAAMLAGHHACRYSKQLASSGRREHCLSRDTADKTS